MADHQRIHPVEMADQGRIHTVQVAETSNSEPLPPSGSSRSGQGEADNELPPQPPATAPEPALPSSETEATPNRRRCYCRCCCWTIVLLLILLLLLCTFFALLLLIFRPKLPKYSFTSLSITDFVISPNASVYAQFDLTITIRNPNKHVGIYYERGSNVSLWYANASLCTGTVPRFYQGSKNTTVLHVFLSGEAQFGQMLMAALQAVEEARQIPLEVRARVPVRLKFGRLKLWKMRFWVWCSLVVDTLSSGSVTSIEGTSCHVFKKKLL